MDSLGFEQSWVHGFLRLYEYSLAIHRLSHALTLLQIFCFFDYRAYLSLYLTFVYQILITTVFPNNLLHKLHSLPFQAFTIKLIHFVYPPDPQKVNYQDAEAKNHSRKY